MSIPDSTCVVIDSTGVLAPLEVTRTCRGEMP